MRLIKQSHEIWGQEFRTGVSPAVDREAILNGVFKHIERAGRICYKSEDKITTGSAQEFVKRLIDSHHYAMLEHGTVYLTIPCRDWHDYDEFLERYGRNPYTQYDDSECNWVGKRGNVYVTTNYRVLVENGWQLDAIENITAPTTKHPRRVTVHFVTSRQVTHELVRHRVMSFAQESTRYCNYSKGKFGGEVTFIEPVWTMDDFQKAVVVDFLQNAEDTYFKLLDIWENKKPDKRYRTGFKGNPLKPQEAAMWLPHALKADIVVTGFVSDWQHLLDLRYKGTTGAPHPQMKALMEPVYNEFVERGYVQ